MIARKGGWVKSVVAVALAAVRSYFSTGIMNDDLLSHPTSGQ